MYVCLSASSNIQSFFVYCKLMDVVSSLSTMLQVTECAAARRRVEGDGERGERCDVHSFTLLITLTKHSSPIPTLPHLHTTIHFVYCMYTNAHALQTLPYSWKHPSRWRKRTSTPLYSASLHPCLRKSSPTTKHCDDSTREESRGGRPSNAHALWWWSWQLSSRNEP